MNKISSAQARSSFPDLLGKATYGKQRTIITKRGKQVAAIIPIEDLEKLQALENSIDIEKIEYALKTEQFEDWKNAKNEIMNHFGFNGNDIQTRDIQES